MAKRVVFQGQLMQVVPDRITLWYGDGAGPVGPVRILIRDNLFIEITDAAVYVFDMMGKEDVAKITGNAEAGGLLRPKTIYRDWTILEFEGFPEYDPVDYKQMLEQIEKQIKFQKAAAKIPQEPPEPIDIDYQYQEPVEPAVTTQPEVH